MSTDKTLADVQPGGRLRLGDQAERARFEAWAEERELGTAKCSADGMDGDYADLNTDWCWAAWRAALSAQPSPGGQAAHCPVKHCGMTYARVPSDGRCHACGAPVQPSPGATALGIPIVVDSTVPPDTFEVRQPSPGGQGDALLESLVARWRNHAEEIGVSDNLLCQKIANCTMRHAAELQAVLAARQPVTMDDALAAGDGTLHGAIDHWQERALRAEAELSARQPVGQEPVGVATVLHSKHFDKTQCTFMRSDVPEGTKLYAAPPAQAVDLGQFVPDPKTVPDCFAEDDSDAQYNSGWNDCRDAVLALIDSKAVQS